MILEQTICVPRHIENKIMKNGPFVQEVFVNVLKKKKTFKGIV